MDDSYSRGKSHSIAVGAENGGNSQCELGFLLCIFWDIGILLTCIYLRKLSFYVNLKFGCNPGRIGISIVLYNAGSPLKLLDCSRGVK